MTYNFTPKKPQKFECLICDFFTCNKKDFDRHVSTQKHQILTNDLQKTPKNPKKPQNPKTPPKRKYFNSRIWKMKNILIYKSDKIVLKKGFEVIEIIS